MDRLTRLLEAALFAASRPVTLDELRRLDPEASEGELRAALTALRLRYDEGGHGIELAELADGWQLLTRPELADALAQAQLVDRPRRLSTAAMETLALVATVNRSGDRRSKTCAVSPLTACCGCCRTAAWWR